ncbi:MAG: tetratricopeptide repeat protein, partial [Alphaproteobacteria bacterium]
MSTTLSAAEALFAEAVARQRAGDLAGAAALYRRALAADPAHGPAALNLGHVLRRLGAPGVADAFRAAADAADDPTLRLRALDGLIGAGRHREAIDRVDVALARAPDDPELRNLRGAALFAAGDVAGARAEFDRARSIAPAQARFHANAGAARRALGQADAAIEAYR